MDTDVKSDASSTSSDAGSHGTQIRNHTSSGTPSDLWMAGSMGKAYTTSTSSSATFTPLSSVSAAASDKHNTVFEKLVRDFERREEADIARGHAPDSFQSTFDRESDIEFEKAIAAPVARYKGVYGMLEAQRKAFWVPSEIDFSSDREDYENLTASQQLYVAEILAFFSIADELVANNLDGILADHLPNAELKVPLRFQAMMEDIHSETYLKALLAVANNDDRLVTRFVNRVRRDLTAATDKLRFVLEWCASSDGTVPLEEACFTLSCIEGVSFASAFLGIMYIRNLRNSPMPGLSHANEKIIEDESMHVRTIAEIYKALVQQHSAEYTKLDATRAHQIIRRCVEAEFEFLERGIPTELVGLKAEQVKTYVQHTADIVLRLYELDPLYGSDNPFPFMAKLGLQHHDNFFERRPSEYSTGDRRLIGRRIAL